MKTYWLERHRQAVECSRITRSARASFAYGELAAHYLSMYHWVEKHVGVAQLPHGELPAGEPISF